VGASTSLEGKGIQGRLGPGWDSESSSLSLGDGGSTSPVILTKTRVVTLSINGSRSGLNLTSNGGRSFGRDDTGSVGELNSIGASNKVVAGDSNDLTSLPSGVGRDGADLRENSEIVVGTVSRVEDGDSVELPSSTGVSLIQLRNFVVTGLVGGWSITLKVSGFPRPESDGVVFVVVSISITSVFTDLEVVDIVVRFDSLDTSPLEGFSSVSSRGQHSLNDGGVGISVVEFSRVSGSLIVDRDIKRDGSISEDGSSWDGADDLSRSGQVSNDSTLRVLCVPVNAILQCRLSGETGSLDVEVVTPEV